MAETEPYDEDQSPWILLRFPEDGDVQVRASGFSMHGALIALQNVVKRHIADPRGDAE